VDCRRCGSVMIQARIETSASSIQRWYTCSLCHAQALNSAPSKDVALLAAQQATRKRGEARARLGLPE